MDIIAWRHSLMRQGTWRWLNLTRDLGFGPIANKKWQIRVENLNIPPITVKNLFKVSAQESKLAPVIVGLNRTGHMSFLNGLDRTPIFAGPDWIRTYIFKHFTYQVQVIDSHKTQIWCQMILDQINKQKKILKKKNWKKNTSCFRTVWENLPYFWTGSDIR